MSSKFYFFLGDEVLNLLWTLLCSAVSIRSRQYQYKMQHVCKWAIIDMNNLSRLLCCRVEEDQLLYVEGDFFPFSVLPNIDGCYFLTEFFPLWCDYLRYFSYRISCILHIVVIKGGGKCIPMAWNDTDEVQINLIVFLLFFSKTFKKDLKSVHDIPGK